MGNFHKTLMNRVQGARLVMPFKLRFPFPECIRTRGAAALGDS